MNNTIHSNSSSKVEREGKRAETRQYDLRSVVPGNQHSGADHHDPLPLRRFAGSDISAGQYGEEPRSDADKVIRMKWDWNKKKKPSILHHLMLNPVSYLHRQRLQLSVASLNPQQQAVINRILLKRYALNIETIAINKLNRPTQWLVKYWYQLPQITFLIACQRLRAELARGGLLLKLPNWARQFALLPLRDSHAQKSSIHLSTNKILALGLSELLSWEAHLPSWLTQRLLLLFPSESEAFIQNVTLHSITPDLNLFLLAAQHAKNHYDPTFANIA